jgi:DNA-binding MarR family transcriptional regulator
MVDSDTAVRLRAAISRLNRQLNSTSTSEGLTPTQASVLALVGARGPLRLAALGELERLNPTMLSRVVGKLTELDLIRRRPDPEDLRAALVEITPAGADLRQRILDRRTERISESLERLPAGGADTVLAALPALEALVEELTNR